MKKLNDDNIDEIMFRLLEGEITGPEREQLLEAIAADEEYTALWNTWQSTILETPEVGVVPDFKHLKKGGGFQFPTFMRYAAILIVILSAVFILYRAGLTKTKPEQLLSGRQKTKTSAPFSTMPAPEQKTDSAAERNVQPKTMREQVRFIAQRDSSVGVTIENEVLVYTNDAPMEIIPVLAIDTAVLPAHKVHTAGIGVALMSEVADTVYSSETKNDRTGLFARLLKRSNIRVVNDDRTLTKKRVIIEGKKYKFIAGF